MFQLFLPFQTLSDSLVNRGDNSSEDENTAEISDPSLIEISSGPAANGDLSDDVSLNDNEDMDLSATASDNDERTGPLSPPSPPLFSPGVGPLVDPQVASMNHLLGPSEDPELPSVLRPSFVNGPTMVMVRPRRRPDLRPSRMEDGEYGVSVLRSWLEYNVSFPAPFFLCYCQLSVCLVLLTFRFLKGSGRR